MAIVQENDQQQTANGNPVNQPIVAGTSAAAGQNGPGAAKTNQNPVSPVQQNAAPQNNNGYTDVSAYLNANQGGGQQIGQGVANNLTQGYNTTMGDINTSAQNATNSVNSGYIPENTQLIQQVANNPTAAAADPNQTSAYQAQLNDTYSGPTTWADTTNAAGNTVGGYGTLQGEVNTAQQNANLLNTPGGNNVLVQQVENQQNPGQTSQGVNALDTLLFGGTPSAVTAAQTAASPYANLGTYLDTQNTNFGNAVTGAQTNAQQASQDALNAFTGSNGTLTNLNTQIGNETSQALTNAQQQEAQVKADLANLYGGQQLQTAGTTLGTYGGGTTPWGNTTNYTVGNLSPQDLASLGMTQDQWNALQGQLQQAGTSTMENGHNFGAGTETTQADLTQWLNQQDPTTLINAGTVATPEQYAQMTAINQLLGSQAPTQTEAINPLNAAQAGTYNPANLNSFNYNAALNATQSYNQQAVAQAKAEAAALTSGADLAHAQSQHGGGILGGLQQAITHPGDLIGSIANPLSWGANLENISKGQTISPTNVNPLKPTTTNSATPLVNNVPTQATAASLANPTLALGAAHGGEVEDLNEYLNKVK